ncbi:hypothetical protein PV325_013985, partial [Microctonus aethiopoides]
GSYRLYLDVQDLLALLAAIGFHVSPKNTRSQNLLNVKVHRNNYRVNSAITRICNLTNSIIQNADVDLFYNDFKKFVHVFDILEVLEDEEINDDLPSLQPINIGIKPDDEILDSFSTETESQLGPSKKLRLNLSFF